MMRKSKISKKILAATLAGSMFLQGGTTYGHAYAKCTENKVLIGTLAGLGESQ